MNGMIIEPLLGSSSQLSNMQIDKKKVWIADDDKSIRWVLEKAFAKEELDVVSFDNADKLLAKFINDRPDVIITDVRMPGTDGITLIDKIKVKAPDVPVIIMTAYSDLDRAVSAFQSGAYEYLPKPFDIEDVISLVKRALQQTQATVNKTGEKVTSTNTDIIGSSTAMQEVFRAIGRLSRSNLTVLITGESGTGKELIARALHRHSPRGNKPFIALNTAAIPRELLESELFGHEKGSFTGANSQRKGRFEQANGGTLFLDEIGDMPPDLQTRLLRVLAEGQFYRVGGRDPIEVDVRVITATHQNLENNVEDGSFREDLFHRLNVIRVHVPALRDRRDDIAVLTEFFLDNAAAELETEVKVMLPKTQAFLNKLPWPGNVRQLENLCRWITVMASGKEIHIDELPPELKNASSSVSDIEAWENTFRHWVKSNLTDGKTELLSEATPKFERILIEEALRKTGGRRQDAAKLLGWGRNTLTRKIKSLGLDT